MSLKSIIGALLLGLLGTQPTTACEETSWDLKDYSTSYTLEGNKALSTQMDQRMPNLTEKHHLEDIKAWTHNPRTIYTLQCAAADGLLLIPHSLAVGVSVVRWPLQTIVGLSILCVVDNWYLYNDNANCEKKLRLEKEYDESKIQQRRNLHPQTKYALMGVIDGLVTVPFSGVYLVCLAYNPLLTIVGFPLMLALENLKWSSNANDCTAPHPLLRLSRGLINQVNKNRD